MTQSVIFTLSLEDFKATISEVIQAEFSKIEKPVAKEAERLLTRKEAAQLLRVSLPTLNQWAKSGILRPKRIGSRVLYGSADIATALQSNGMHRTRNRQRYSS